MARFTEKQLIDLGFTKETETQDADPFYYYIHYTYDSIDFLSMISCTDNEAIDNKFTVEFFDDLDGNTLTEEDIRNIQKINERIKFLNSK